MSHDSCPTILTQSVAQCAQICADGGATIKQSPRLMALSQSADVDARTRGFFAHGGCRRRRRRPHSSRTRAVSGWFFAVAQCSAAMFCPVFAFTSHPRSMRAMVSSGQSWLVAISISTVSPPDLCFTCASVLRSRSALNTSGVLNIPSRKPMYSRDTAPTA